MMMMILHSLCHVGNSQVMKLIKLLYISASKVCNDEICKNIALRPDETIEPFSITMDHLYPRTNFSGFKKMS